MTRKAETTRRAWERMAKNYRADAERAERQGRAKLAALYAKMAEEHEAEARRSN